MIFAMPSWFISGASRGIGLGIVEELLKDPRNYVIAAARNPGGSTGLQNLAAQVSADRLALVTLDLAESSSIRRAVEEASRLLPHGLDYLVNNAAVILQSSAVRTFEEIDLELFEKELRINTIAPLELARFLLPLVRASKEKKVIFITSDGGSIQLAPQWPTLIVTYSVTKAGLNMLARKWGAHLKPEGITVVLLHPGYVATEMASMVDEYMAKHAPGLQKSTVSESAISCIKVITEAQLEEATPYFNYDGTELPW